MALKAHYRTQTALGGQVCPQHMSALSLTFSMIIQYPCEQQNQLCLVWIQHQKNVLRARKSSQLLFGHSWSALVKIQIVMVFCAHQNVTPRLCCGWLVVMRNDYKVFITLKTCNLKLCADLVSFIKTSLMMLFSRKTTTKWSLWKTSTYLVCANITSFLSRARYVHVNLFVYLVPYYQYANYKACFYS